MQEYIKLRLTASIFLLVGFLIQAQGADKYTDENRPYEFGFKIDGQQHRHESKDKDGIIMGEFGFITADDVYHVTVYATDKEGRFKILSMKNIHLKSSPSSSDATSARQGHALALPPVSTSLTQPDAPQGPFALQTPSIPQTPFAPQPFKPISIEPPGRSCSSCSLPTTSTRAPPPELPTYNQYNGNNNYNSPSQFGAPGSNYQGSQGGQQNYPTGLQNYPQQELGISQNYPQSESGIFQNNPQQGSGISQNYPQQESSISQNYPQQGFDAPGSSHINTQQPSQLAQNYPGSPPYVQGPGANNYAQPRIFLTGQNLEGGVQQFGSPQTYPGAQNSLAGGNSGPYAGFEGLGGSGPAGSIPQAGNNGQGPQQEGLAGSGPAGSIPQAGTYGQGYPQQELSGPNAQTPGQSSYSQGGTGSRISKQYNGPEQQISSNVGPNGPQGFGPVSGGQPGFTKPTLVSAQMQIVDKNTNVHALRPGEKEGLPPGLTKDDMTQLLYTFNYTVGFHGHFEEGYTNGVKKGYYFVTGRNGVKTRIDYVADDTGFHPKVSQDVLDLLSDDVPKPETEMEAKYGLKGYEFKWLYYPVESS